MIIISVSNMINYIIINDSGGFYAFKKHFGLLSTHLTHYQVFFIYPFDPMEINTTQIDPFISKWLKTATETKN